MSEALYDVFFAFTLGLKMAEGLDVSLNVESDLYTLTYNGRILDENGQPILSSRGNPLINEIELLTLRLNRGTYLQPELLSFDPRGPEDFIENPEHLNALLYAYRPFLLQCIEEHS